MTAAMAVFLFSSCYSLKTKDFCHPPSHSGYVKQTGGAKWKNPSAARPPVRNKYAGR
jgi:hypothetical protein